MVVALTLSSISMNSFSEDLRGTVTTADGTPVCAMVLASGQYMFSCDYQGAFELNNLATEPDGTITLQVYADGFFPNVTSLSEFFPQTVIMQPANGSSDGTELPGIRTAKASAWLFAASIPIGLVGPATFTWSTDSELGNADGIVTSTHTPWVTEKPLLTDGSGGQTLWEASVLVRGGVGTVTNNFDWVYASIQAVGYVAADGGPGGTGAPGVSSVVAYTAMNEGLLFNQVPYTQTGAVVTSVPGSLAVLTE